MYEREDFYIIVDKITDNIMWYYEPDLNFEKRL